MPLNIFILTTKSLHHFEICENRICRFVVSVFDLMTSILKVITLIFKTFSKTNKDYYPTSFKLNLLKVYISANLSEGPHQVVLKVKKTSII